MAWRYSEGLRNKLLGAASGEGSLKQVMANGQIRIFSGSQPATAELGEQGTHLCTITLASGAMETGVGTNGINLGNAAAAIIGKAAEVWSGLNLAAGSAGWFRWYPNAFTANAGAATSGDKIRIDGAIGVGTGELRLSSVNLVKDVTTTIGSVELELPM